jgi:hypothetical protein
MRFNPPPGWPSPPDGWIPPPGWNPDPSWPAPPDGWQLWLSDTDDTSTGEAPAVGRSADAAASLAPTDPAAAATQLAAGLTRGRHVADDPLTPETIEHAAEADRAVLLARIAELEATVAAQTARGEVIELSDQRVLQDVGIYR